MKIIVLIINYNSWDKTLAMLESGDALEVIPEFYVLDNNSDINPIPCIRTIREKYSDVNIVNFATNFGYFGAVHEFLRVSPHLQFDWLFIANSDLLFSDPCVFNYLDDFLAEAQGVGIYCPSVISAVTGRDQNPFLLKKPSRLYYYKYAIISSSFMLSKLYYSLFMLKSVLMAVQHKRTVKQKCSRYIFAPHGSFLGFSSTFFQKGGVIENRNFLFYEEEIAGFICDALGLVVVYDPRVQIFHEEHATTGSGLTKAKICIKKKSLSILKKYMLI